jgi:hypothetical protein
MAPDYPVPASPVELTDEEIAERAQAMFALDQQIRAGLSKGREGLWEAAKALYEFDEQSGWSALGYESVRHYCADPGIEISRSTYHRMTRAYQQTVVLRQVDFERMKLLDRSKVDIVLAKVTTGEKRIDDALDDAETLGMRDLRDLYWGPEKEAKNGDGGVNVDTTEDETGVVTGLDDDVIDGNVVEEDESWTGSAEEDEFDAVAENETTPQLTYGEVLGQQLTEALEACQQALETPSDLLRRVALEKAIRALEAVLDAG